MLRYGMHTPRVRFNTETSRLDYANSILYGIPAKHISRLQRTQTTPARVATTGKRCPSILKELHWLPIDARVKF